MSDEGLRALASDGRQSVALTSTTLLALLDRLERQARTIRRLYAITHPNSAPPDPEATECFAEAKEIVRDEAIKAERDALRAQVERVRALADRWEARADDYLPPVSSVMHTHAKLIRAALDGPQ